MIQDEEEITHDSEVEQQEETVEVVDTETEEETPEAKLAKAEAEANKYRRLYEKASKPKTVTTEASKEQATPLNVEEAVLLAQGFDEDLLPELKAVAQVRKVNLIKAQNDPIFVAVKEKFEKDKKREEASMPASRGSGSVKAKKDFTTPGLTREEHMALVRAQLQS